MRLKLNAKKTEVIAYNILPDHSALITTGGTVLKEVNDFKYLGTWMNSTEQDLKVRKTLTGKLLIAWPVCGSPTSPDISRSLSSPRLQSPFSIWL